MDPDAFVQGLETRLRAVASSERAENEKRYLKSDLEFWGATVGQIRAAVRDVGREHRRWTHDEVVATVERSWSASVHERRMASVFLLERFGRLLRPDDLPLIERLLRESRTWALVDGLAGDVVGRLAALEPDRVGTVLDRWATDTDFWIRRASLLAELRPIRSGAALDRFVARAEPMLDETEFFIRKAIGWVLREAGKKRPDEVVAWLAPRTHRASGVTMREAIKYVPAPEAQWLMGAYRDKRPAA